MGLSKTTVRRESDAKKCFRNKEKLFCFTTGVLSVARRFKSESAEESRRKLIQVCVWSFVLKISLLATVRKYDAVQRSNLTDFGKYVAECLPKYVQKVQLTSGDELEVLIAPEGVLPVLQFLKDHHQAQFENLVDIAG